MRKFGATLLVLGSMLSANGADVDTAKMQREMMQTVVRVDAGEKVGSGTVIFSSKIEQAHDDKVYTFVLTNNHVIADPDDKGGRPLKSVQVEQYVYDSHGVQIAMIARPTKVIAADVEHDLAVLKLADQDNVMPAANIEPADDDIAVFDQVYAVGAGLGQAPFPTVGMISNTDSEEDGNRYIMESAPIINGNSGGALFKYSAARKRYELIGVPTLVSGHHGVAVSHMGFAIPMNVVREFVQKSGGNGIM